MRDELGYLLGQQFRGQPLLPTPMACIVSRSDSTGVWVTPIGADTSSPLGPCVGGTRPKLTGTQQTGYQLVLEQLPVGTKCLAINTSEGPFVVSP